MPDERRFLLGLGITDWGRANGRRRHIPRPPRRPRSDRLDARNGEQNGSLRRVAPFGMTILVGSSLYLQHDERAVVKRVASIREGIHRFQNVIGDTVGWKLVIFGDECPQAIVAVKFHRRRILRVADSVGVNEYDIARVENVASLIVDSLFKHPKRKSFQRISFATAVVIQKGLLLACVCDAQLMTPAMPRGET